MNLLVVLAVDAVLWGIVYGLRREPPGFDFAAGTESNVAVAILNISVFAVATVLR